MRNMQKQMLMQDIIIILATKMSKQLLLESLPVLVMRMEILMLFRLQNNIMLADLIALEHLVLDLLDQELIMKMIQTLLVLILTKQEIFV
jgi:hypothetical protein